MTSSIRASRRRRLSDLREWQDSAAAELPKSTGWILAAACLGTFMAILDTSLVNLGLHAIQQDLHADMSMLQWVIDLYNLVYGAFILTGGALSDLYGRRRIFMPGSLLFLAGSVVCAIAQDATILIAGRGISGLGAALELPAALALLNVAYPDPDRRVRAIAIWGGMNGLAMAIGPTMGGLLVDAFDWRSLFWAIVPVAAATIGLTAWRVPETAVPGERHLDLVGQALAILALATLALVFIEGPNLGWQSPLIIGCAIACVVATGVFLLVEAHNTRPLVPLGMFQNRPFSASILDALLMTFGMYGLLFVLPLYFQAIRHASATAAGIALLPLSAVFFLVSPLAGRVATTLGPRALISAGMALTGLGLLVLAFVTEHMAYWSIAVPLVGIGIGLGLITGPIATVAVANAPAERSGMASGLVNMGRLIGATLGVAVLGVLFGAQAAKSIANAPQFLHGLHGTFLVGGIAELAGVAVALFWLRADSLKAPEAAASGQNDTGDTVPESRVRPGIGLAEIKHMAAALNNVSQAGR